MVKIVGQLSQEPQMESVKAIAKYWLNKMLIFA